MEKTTFYEFVNLAAVNVSSDRTPKPWDWLIDMEARSGKERV